MASNVCLPEESTPIESAAGVSVRLPELPVTGICTALLVDISDSMSTTDMSTMEYTSSRLDAAKEAAVELVKERSQIAVESRLAIVGFSDLGYLVCPLTDCRDIAKVTSAISSLSTVAGTNIGAGLSMAAHILHPLPFIRRACEIVLLSDGYDCQSDAVPVAEKLKARGGIIRTVGIGGSPEAVDEALLKHLASKDENGNPYYRFISDKMSLVRHFKDIGGLTR
jgi:Mg-chelatase subunit ChlD